MHKIIRYSLLLLPLIGGCSRLATIPDATQTPESWCQNHPCATIDIGIVQFTLNEPSSSFFVYFLGFLTLWFGIHLFKRRAVQKSKLWFSLALIFWGIAAILAGTSYQAFSYEIKCAGQAFCSWTSWWEIYYYLFQSFSMNAFVVAIAYSSTEGKLRKNLMLYAAINAIIYNAVLFTGAFLPNKFMVSFELFTLISAPNFLILFIINTKNYLKTKELLDLRLMWLWFLQGVIIVVYFIYLFSGYPEQLWAKGIWFNANDLLHVLIIFWQLYIFFFVVKKLRDYPV